LLNERSSGGKTMIERAGLALLVAVTAASPNLAAAHVGVAFVHGTGTQHDALHEYWTPAFVESVASGLPDPHAWVVVDCDLGQLMWSEAAAGCIVDQLLDFTESHDVEQLVVVTHSHGGNVLRWILSNPTWDPRYPQLIERIAWVNALAPSSLGTPLADAVVNGNTFETSLGWMLGYQNDAVAQQQVAHMAYYNDTWLLGTHGRPDLPIGFWSVVGSDVQSNPFNSDNYCGGYHLTVGLELTQYWLSSCSDGFLDCSSQAGAGRVWAYDWQFTAGGRALNHAQSRRACFGLDDLLRADLVEAAS
jgi:hypothetical protein